MLPLGAEQLIAMRKRGFRPTKDVWVNVGTFQAPDWWKYQESVGDPEILIRPTDAVERLDLRCVAGLSVTLYFVAWTEHVAKVYDALQEYASEIAVMSPCFESDCGWYWIKGIGQVEIKDRWRIDAIRVAQQNRMAAAMKGDRNAYEHWRQKEMHALEGAPWRN